LELEWEGVFFVLGLGVGFSTFNIGPIRNSITFVLGAETGGFLVLAIGAGTGLIALGFQIGI